MLEYKKLCENANSFLTLFFDSITHLDPITARISPGLATPKTLFRMYSRSAGAVPFNEMDS